MGKIIKESQMTPEEVAKMGGLKLFSPLKFEKSTGEGKPAAKVKLLSQVDLLKKVLKKHEAKHGADTRTAQSLRDQINSYERSARGEYWENPFGSCSTGKKIPKFKPTPKKSK